MDSVRAVNRIMIIMVSATVRIEVLNCHFSLLLESGLRLVGNLIIGLGIRLGALWLRREVMLKLLYN